VEVGTVDVHPGVWDSSYASSLDDFKKQIEPRVCEAGGDAAVALVNGGGGYVKATVLKSTGAPASTQPTAATAGCQFDTQCKGDRVCVKGECVEPAKK
jgi:hypothetical protein